jgi:L-iditol 2-dehydrogenase
LDEGALCEPLAVGVKTTRRAELKLGQTVFITGAGPIGLINMLVAKYMGASKVVMSDIRADRLEFAKELGADYTITVDGTYDATRLAKEVVEALGGQPNVTIECSGAEISIQAAIRATKSGGKVVLVGYTPPEVTVPLVDAATREVDIRGVFRYENCYPEALSIVASGKVDVKKLITHNFSIEETLEAFETARTGAGGAIKVMIHC